MGTRKGRRIALASVVAVVVLASTLVWLSREHGRLFIAALGRTTVARVE